MNDKIVKYLLEHPALSLNQLEKEAKLPQSLLSKVTKGKRKLNESHLDKVIPVLKRYGFNPEKD